MKNQLNILMIMADQFRFRTLDGMGDHIPVPNIKRIMDRGITFDRASCTCPLCTPSRASLATGKYPGRCGVPIHDAILPPEQKTYYQMLRDAGYRVGVAGKTDLHKKDRYCGVKGNLPSIYHYGFTEAYETEGKMNCARIILDENGQKKLMGPYQKYLNDKGLLETLRDYYRDYMRKKPRYFAGPSPLPDDDFQDNFIGRAACSWLSEVEKDREPWHYLVSFAGPHNPWDPPKADYDCFQNTEFPEAVRDDLNGKPEWIKERAKEQTAGMDRDKEQNMKRCYAGSVHVIDRWVGEILDILEERGLADNTAVIFCADHGELLGDHGLVEKSAMYESALRVPLIIHLPGMTSASTCSALVELMDLAPTCLDLAGVKYNPDEMDAKSMLPLLKEGGCKENPFKPVQISELHNCLMIFDGRYKWIRNWNDRDELYDLTADPEERKNIFTERPDVIESLKKYTFMH
jgi:arylsulfatase